MKYRILEHSDTDFDIITEDGGIASIWQFAGIYKANYYQRRLTEINPDEDVWEQLGEGKVYYKEWYTNPSKHEVISDALRWLVVSSTPINWEIDNSLFIQISNQILN